MSENISNQADTQLFSIIKESTHVYQSIYVVYQIQNIYPLCFQTPPTNNIYNTMIEQLHYLFINLRCAHCAFDIVE